MYGVTTAVRKGGEASSVSGAENSSTVLAWSVGDRVEGKLEAAQPPDGQPNGAAPKAEVRRGGREDMRTTSREGGWERDDPKGRGIFHQHPVS